MRWNGYSKLIANLFLVFLCFQIVLAFNTNGTYKTEVMPLAVRASLFLTVVSHLTLTPLLVKCLPLVNSVPYSIQCKICCLHRMSIPFPDQQFKDVRLSYIIFTENCLSLVQKRFTENWVLPTMGALHQTEPIRWYALCVALGRAFFLLPLLTPFTPANWYEEWGLVVRKNGFE